MVIFIRNSGDSDRNNDHVDSNNTASSYSRHVQDAVITAWAAYHCRESCERWATTSLAMLATSPTSSACQAALACAVHSRRHVFSSTCQLPMPCVSSGLVLSKLLGFVARQSLGCREG